MSFNSKRFGKTALVGLAFMSISCFWGMYDGIVPLILKYSFNMNEVLNGVVMAMDNVLAVLLLPIFGIWSDRTKTRFGKRMPFIAIGTFAAIAAMIVMPIADNLRNLPLFLTMTGLVLLFMAFFRSPAVALMPDITPKKLRSFANAIIMLMGTAGAIYALLAVKFLVKESENSTPNYVPLFVSIALFMAVATIIMIIAVPENKWVKEAHDEDPEMDAPEEEVNKGKKLPKDKMTSLLFLLFSVAFWYMAYNAVTTAFSRYSKEVLGMDTNAYTVYMMIATVSAIISYIPIGILAEKFGRKKVILAGVAGLAVTFASCFFFSKGGLLLMTVFVFIGISWGAINVNSFPMVVEIASSGDEGKYTGIYYTFSMAAQVITPVFSGVFLEHVSYKSLFPYAAVFAVLAFFTMLMVKHGDTIPVKKKSLLEHLDVDD